MCIMVKLFKSGRTGNYYGQFCKPDGTRKQFSCHTSNKRKADAYAQAHWQELLKEIEESSGNPKQSYTLSEFADFYLQRLKAHLSEWTIIAYRDSFTQLIKRVGDTSLSDLTLFQCHEFIYNNQPSTETAARHFRQLRRALTLAVRWDILKDNPFSHLDAPKPVHKRKDTFTEEQFNTFIDNLPTGTFAERRFKRMTIFARISGLRLSEILYLNAPDILFEKDVILVKNSEAFRTKSGKERFVPLSTYGATLLANQLEDNINHTDVRVRNSSIVFPNNTGGNLSKYTVSEVFRQFKNSIMPEKANICFHSLRGTFITSAYDDGVPIAQIQKAVGHRTIRTTEGYINYDLINLVKLQDSLNKIKFKEN